MQQEAGVGVGGPAVAQEVEEVHPLHQRPAAHQQRAGEVGGLRRPWTRGGRGIGQCVMCWTGVRCDWLVYDLSVSGAL